MSEDGGFAPHTKKCLPKLQGHILRLRSSKVKKNVKKKKKKKNDCQKFMFNHYSKGIFGIFGIFVGL